MTEEEENNKFIQELLASSKPTTEESLREFIRKVEAWKEVLDKNQN